MKQLCIYIGYFLLLGAICGDFSTLLPNQVISQLHTNEKLPSAKADSTSLVRLPGNILHILAEPNLGGNTQLVLSPITSSVDSSQLLHLWVRADKIILGAELHLAYDCMISIERMGIENKFSAIGVVSLPLKDSIIRFIDPLPLWGTNHYRLKWQKSNGEFVFSETVQVDFKPSVYLMVSTLNMPQSLDIQHVGLNAGITSMVLYNQLGQMVYTADWYLPAEGTEIIDMSKLSSGEYYYQVWNGTNIRRGRITLRQ